jgi:glutaryl-CoA dehydrogenase
MTADTSLSAVFDPAVLLSAEEVSWRDRARGFAAARIAPSIDTDFEAARFREELVPELGAQGFLGMHLTGYGCAGAGAVSYGAVCMELEAVDSAWRTFVSVQGSLAMSAIAEYGSEEQKSQLLPQLASGALIGCFALTEPQSGSDPAAMTTRAARDGGDWILTGAKRWIGLASVADVAVVWAATDEGVRGFLVPTTAPGFSAVAIEGKLSMRASVQCDVRLESVRVPDDALLPGARGLSGPFGCLNEARFGIAWGVMGAARACLEAALGHTLTRTSFGGPLASRQLVQAKLAEMLLEYEKGVLLAVHLGRRKEAGALDPVQISVGKLNNVRAALEVAGTARSLLGGDGVTDAFPVMRHLANLEAVRTYEGTDEIHQLVIGRALTGISAFG